MDIIFLIWIWRPASYRDQLPRQIERRRNLSPLTVSTLLRGSPLICKLFSGIFFQRMMNKVLQGQLWTERLLRILRTHDDGKAQLEMQTHARGKGLGAVLLLLKDLKS